MTKLREETMPTDTLLGLDQILSSAPLFHQQKMLGVLLKLLPSSESTNPLGLYLSSGSPLYPLISWEESLSEPSLLHFHSPLQGTLSIYLLCPKATQLELDTFFPELFKKWLIPQRESPLLSFNHMCFSTKDNPEIPLFIGETTLLIETPHQRHLAFLNLPILSQELKTAILSPRHATHLLSRKSVLPHPKVSLVHRELNRAMQKFPNYLDEKLLHEVELFSALVSKEFLEQRNALHLARLVTSIHLFRKNLLHALTYSPHIHHLQIRLLHTSLKFPFCCKPVLGCLIGLNFTEEHETLEDTHVLSAIKKFIPTASLVKGSVYSAHHKEEKVKILYLELTKEDETPFSSSEKTELKERLQADLVYHIEKLIPSVFMARNEEDILRNILMLRREIRSTQDLPQAIISLDRHTATEVVFNLVFVFLSQASSLQKKLSQICAPYSLFIERAQSVGYFRKKHPIDALVVRIHLPKEPSFLRNDLSLNFYLAREALVSLLQEAIGDFRDYNGGVIFRQTEMLSKLKKEFPNLTETRFDLLENFFYSISPIEKQALIPISLLIPFFQLLTDTLDAPLDITSGYLLKVGKERDTVFATIRFQDPSLKEHLTSTLDSFKKWEQGLVTSEISRQHSSVICYLYEAQEEASQELFIEKLTIALENWRAQRQPTKMLRLNLPFLPSSLDPRLAGDEFSGTILRLLFEGLMRLNRYGKLEPALAKEVLISEDQKHYTFKLRKSYWNNQDPVTAYDFEYAWKLILSVDFQTPFAYFFYPIKNAKEAKRGLRPLDDVGITALDAETLHVELDFPAHYFLELTAHSLFSPINQRIDRLHPSWPTQAHKDYVCNGSFELDIHLPNQSYEFVKNPSYWDAENIELEKVSIAKGTLQTAIQHFYKQEMDWLGLPFYPWDSAFVSTTNTKLVSHSNVSTYWYVFNTQRFPFHNQKLRYAFSLAIDRSLIAETLSREVNPAYALLLPRHTQTNGPFFRHDLSLAKELFEEALEELHLSRETFPSLGIACSKQSMREIVISLIQNQWEDAFGVRCHIESIDWKWLVKRLMRGEFQVGAVLWRSIIDDPIYFLNTFRYKEEPTNFSRWEQAAFSDALFRADHASDLLKRQEHLAAAEQILYKGCPATPIFYTHFKTLVSNKLQPPHCSPLGILDVKWSTIQQ